MIDNKKLAQELNLINQILGTHNLKFGEASKLFTDIKYEFKGFVKIFHLTFFIISLKMNMINFQKKSR